MHPDGLACSFLTRGRPIARAASARLNPSALRSLCTRAFSSQSGLLKTPPRDALAKLRSSVSFRCLLSLCTTHQANFSENHILAVWSKICNLSKPTTWKHSVTLSGFLDATLRSLLWSGPRTVSSVAHSAAKAKYYSTRLFEAVADLSRERSEDFKAQNLAMTVWAFATVDQRAPQLFEVVAMKAEERLEDFNSQGLANMVWAFATVDRRASQLFYAVAEKAGERLEDFNAQDLANIVWAFATVDQRAPRLFEAVAEKAEERLEDFKAQGLANIVWAFATFDQRAPRLFEAVAEKAEERLEDFDAQNLANIVWALATVDQRAPQLVEAVAEKAGERFEDSSRSFADVLASLMQTFVVAGLYARGWQMLGRVGSGSQPAHSYIIHNLLRAGCEANGDDSRVMEISVRMKRLKLEPPLIALGNEQPN